MIKNLEKFTIYSGGKEVATFDSGVVEIFTRPDYGFSSEIYVVGIQGEYTDTDEVGEQVDFEANTTCRLADSMVDLELESVVKFGTYVEYTFGGYGNNL